VVPRWGPQPERTTSAMVTGAGNWTLAVVVMLLGPSTVGRRVRLTAQAEIAADTVIVLQQLERAEADVSASLS